MIEDYDLISASFRAQYGIDLRRTELEYTEFLNLCSCLMPETPLGSIVAVRSEKDPEVLKRFTLAQNRIRNEWIKKHNNNYNMDALFKAALM